MCPRCCRIALSLPIILCLLTFLHLHRSRSMNLSQILGGRNEYSGTSGNESGWTHYMDSTIQENNYDDDNTEVVNDFGFLSTAKQIHQKDGYGNSDVDDCGSNDSMTSDASSGPSHFEISCSRRKSGLRKVPPTTANTKHDKLHKQVKQRDGPTKSKKVKEELLHTSNTTASRAHSGIKVRKIS